MHASTVHYIMHYDFTRYHQVNFPYTNLHGFQNEVLTTSTMLISGYGFPSAGQSILWRESVAQCAPLSTAFFADKNTRNFPSGLWSEKQKIVNPNQLFKNHFCWWFQRWNLFRCINCATALPLVILCRCRCEMRAMTEQWYNQYL